MKKLAARSRHTPGRRGGGGHRDKDAVKKIGSKASEENGQMGSNPKEL